MRDVGCRRCEEGTGPDLAPAAVDDIVTAEGSDHHA